MIIFNIQAYICGSKLSFQLVGKMAVKTIFASALPVHRYIAGLPFVFYCIASLLTGEAKAQKFGLSAEFGQQFGISKRKAQDVPFAAARDFSMGNGVSRQLMFHIYPDSSNWYLSFGLFNLSGNTVITAEKSTSMKHYQALTWTANSLRMIARVSYLARIRAYSLNFSAGLALPVLARIKEAYSVRDSVSSSVTTARITNYASIGFNGSIGVARQITPGIRLFLNSDIQVLSHQVKHRTVTGYESTNGSSLETQYPDVATRETVYHRDVTQIRNNRDVLPQRFNPSQPTDKLAYRVSDSSIGFQVGFQFLF